jgi:hypothetical protein
MALHESTFGFLKPTDEQISHMARVREASKAYADVIERELPDGPDKTYILRVHRQNAMWANVSITRAADGSPLVNPE